MNTTNTGAVPQPQAQQSKPVRRPKKWLFTADGASVMVSVLALIATCLIGYFGQKVSSAVLEIQRRSDERNEARELQEFWAKTQEMTRRIDDGYEGAGKAVARFVVASGEYLDAYDMHFRQGTLASMESDPEYLSTYAKCLSSYANLETILASIRQEYSYFLIQSRGVAETYKLEGWAVLQKQDQSVKAWTGAVHQDSKQLMDAIERLRKGRGDPASIINSLNTSSKDLGLTIGQPNPYRAALGSFLDANLSKQP